MTDPATSVLRRAHLGLRTWSLQPLNNNLTYSQDNFSFRLAQWLVEQFDSHEALGTVSNQLATLISQEQPGSRTNLNIHIGGLIFKKATHNPTDGLAQLCTRLCHSLFLQDLKRDSSFSSQCVHDRTFQLCISSLEATNSEQKDDPGVVSLPDISVLVTELYNYGLIPIAHVYAYLKRLTTSNGPLESRLLGLCTILEVTGWALNFGPWRTERESVIQWANDTVEKSPLDEHVKTRIKTITCAQDGSHGWQSYSEPGLPVEEQGPLGLATPEQYTGSTSNPPAQSQALNDAVSSHQTVDPEHNRVERNESSSPSTLSEKDDTHPSKSTSPAQSIADSENSNRNNCGYHTGTHNDGIQMPQLTVSPPGLAITTPTQAATSAAPPRGTGGSGFDSKNPSLLSCSPQIPPLLLACIQPSGSSRMGGAVPLPPQHPHHYMHHPGHLGHLVYPKPQLWGGYYPPQGYYDRCMYWQHEQHPHQHYMPQIHTSLTKPSPRTQPAERKSKEEKQKAKEAEERRIGEEEERKVREAAKRKAKEEERRAKEENLKERKAKEEEERIVKS